MPRVDQLKHSFRKQGYEQAKKLDIEGRSRMNKKELTRAISRAR